MGRRSHQGWSDTRVSTSRTKLFEGKGKIVETRPHSPYLFGVVQQREKVSEPILSYFGSTKPANHLKQNIVKDVMIQLPVEKVDRGDSASSVHENGTSPSGKSVNKNKNLESNISFGGGEANQSTLQS